MLREAGSFGIDDDQDDVDRPFLSGDLGGRDHDEDCDTAGFVGY